MTPARRLFAEEVSAPDAPIDTLRAALLIAVEDDPDAAIEPAMAQLDALAAGLPPALATRPPRAQIEALAAHLHGAMGFHGNSTDYYSPLNSLMTQVLARRSGIPITLALVYTEVARRVGIVLLPIGLPG